RGEGCSAPFASSGRGGTTPAELVASPARTNNNSSSFPERSFPRARRPARGQRRMIQVEHLSKYYGPIKAVYGITFAVRKGEIVGFLGPNGAGKSTTLKILTSYLPATSGTARVAGFDVRSQSMEVRQNIGYLPQSVPIYPEMRVQEYLEYRAKLKGVDRS